MNAALAFSLLRSLDVPAFTTADARALFGGTEPAASQTLAALTRQSLVVPLRRGLWTLDANIDPLLLPEWLSAPAPSYVSLLTALYRHGVIEQIPAVVYAVTLGKTKRDETNVGNYSLHRVAPEIFGGFEIAKNGVKLATAEKALVDVAYLSGTKGRLFAALPEIEVPRGFSVAEVRWWVKRIPSARHRVVSNAWLARHVMARRRTQNRGAR